MCVHIFVVCDELALPTGQVQEGELEEIPTSIEVGLLGHLRKLVSLMTDVDAKRVMGDVLHHEMLIAIAHNKNIVVRTAVIRVSETTPTQRERERMNVH